MRASSSATTGARTHTCTHTHTHTQTQTQQQTHTDTHTHTHTPTHTHTHIAGTCIHILLQYVCNLLHTLMQTTMGLQREHHAPPQPQPVHTQTHTHPYTHKHTDIAGIYIFSVAVCMQSVAKVDANFNGTETRTLLASPPLS